MKDFLAVAGAFFMIIMVTILLVAGCQNLSAQNSYNDICVRAGYDYARWYFDEGAVCEKIVYIPVEEVIGE